MFGFRYIKARPHIHLIQYRDGKVIRQGQGLSFWYFAPSTSLVAVPLASVDHPFMFQDTTADFQEVSIQGQMTFRIADPQKTATQLDLSLDKNGVNYHSEDLKTLPDRVIRVVRVRFRTLLEKMTLREALGSAETIVQQTRKDLDESHELAPMGIEILTLSILAIKPTPETARALEAEIREEILRRSDQATYDRRNAAVEQERAIRENELNTEIALEKKKRRVREEKIEADRAVKQKQHLIKEEEMTSKISLEESRKQLVALSCENTREKADAEAYKISSVMTALNETDPKTLQALASVGMDPGKMVAMGFRDLAESAGKIGQLNISPDLLRELIHVER